MNNDLSPRAIDRSLFSMKIKISTPSNEKIFYVPVTASNDLWTQVFGIIEPDYVVQLQLLPPVAAAI